MIASAQTGIPIDQHRAGVGRHRPGARRRRHDGLALAAAGWCGRRQGRHRAGRAGQEAGRPALEAAESDIVLDIEAGRVPRRRHAGRVAGRGPISPASPPPSGDAAARSRPASRRQGADVPVRRPRRRRRGRRRDRAACRHVRHVACDDAGRVINPLILEGQIHGGVAQGAAQALLEEVRYDERRQPDHVEPGRLRDDLGRRAAQLRDRAHGDADARQPARRQGHRRVGHDRLDAGRAVGRRRRPVATSASATSTCRPPPSGCGRRSRPPSSD